MLITALLNALQIVSADEGALRQAAHSHCLDAQWKLNQAITADVACDGKRDVVLLGSTEHEVIILVFRSGLKKKPDAILFQTSRVAKETVSLTTESLDVDDTDFKQMLGETPEGFRRSKICKGLRLSDGQKDALHVYWHRKRHELSAWSL